MLWHLVLKSLGVVFLNRNASTISLVSYIAHKSTKIDVPQKTA